MEKYKVAIQGWQGANHDIAARAYFNGGEVEIEPCLTFYELFDKVGKDQNGLLGMVAIENTLVGSLLSNYTLLKNSGLSVLGEHKLRIRHQLMTLPGQTIADIKEVHSHPMALAQCEQFFREYPHIRLIESEDTALSAKLIQEGKIKGVAAIASSLAAKLYNLEIIAKDIETNKHNYTRFLVVGKPNKAEFSKMLEQNLVNKSSIVFSVPHEEGSLSKVLTILAFYRINLSKIQSLPIVGQEWQYLMYIDIDFNDYQRYLQSLDAIRPLCEQLSVLGEYRAADTLYVTNGDAVVKKADAEN
ncbi:prephenate dehydratase [Natronoflexus pectinivorans]|uniref:prephenate dehydratase n=1 Tax=Natronoflexus pectinivorans TaxID=682526 RepID=A0A4R2GHF0_9BACT|nr:prephenate dehydratase [Natronoflexus pectinivorans]TCO07644.1 prephenate dehydratase [Natronoflexus pectinivorans]